MINTMQIKLIKWFIYGFTLLILVYLSGCQSESNKRLKFTLSRAGENRGELEKVLEHYKNDPLKLEAARFLIEYMPGHARYDTTCLEQMQPIYDRHEAISQRYNWEKNTRYDRELDDLWKEEHSKINFSLLQLKEDVKSIKADFLIDEIELAFKAWHENVYTKNETFESFCKYILPYRIQNGICLDNSRELFYKRHAGFFNDSTVDFRTAVDSLHYQYRFLTHSNWSAASMPLYRAKTFEQIKRGLCVHKVWYNILLSSALGITICNDFIPAWGNRGNSHGWNAIVLGNETYPFEPFWEENRWIYKKIYDNKTPHLLFGKFRLPKVYRSTYEYHFTGPMLDKEIKISDIPPLFRNSLKEDVSHAYFDTTNLTIQITEPIPENTKYCYLCVYDTKGWIPVQYGKIKHNKEVTFEGMGRDIIYCPAFYKNGTFKPAAPLQLIEPDGTYESMEKTQAFCSITSRALTSDITTNEIIQKEVLTHSTFIAYPDSIDTKPDTLFHLTDTIDPWYNMQLLHSSKKYRYLALSLPAPFFSLCEISVFELVGNSHVPVEGIRVKTNAESKNPDEKIEMIVDGLSGTGFQGSIKNKLPTIIFDLGVPRHISAIAYIPYTQCVFKNTLDLELSYWDNEWIPAGRTKGNPNCVTFEHVPSGAVYRIKSRNYWERIFTYEDGIIHWY